MSAVAPRVPTAILIMVFLCTTACDPSDEEHGVGDMDRAKRVAEVELAPGYGPLGFEAPTPGSYRLPPLGDASDGRVLAADGSSIALHDVLDGKVTILSLMYASCSDVNGCPLATAVLHQISNRMKKDAALAGGLRLVSLSFDPVRDTPEVMARQAAHHAGGEVDWQFVTTASQDDLRPILDGYGQSLVRELDAEGQDLGEISHMLRVFLIDASKRIRNIYSVSYLHADSLVADVQTLLMESGDPTRTSGEAGAAPIDPSRPGEAEVAARYAEPSTGSVALASRRGEAVDLVARAEAGQLGLPKVAIPPDNPLSREKVELGRRLFFDRRLSQNGTQSCAMCHVPEQGFASNELATAVGIEGRTVRRNSPTILNVGFAKRLFHDAREDRLEHQVWGPLLAHNEMGNASVGVVLGRIRSIEDYEERFEAAFPSRRLAIETVGMAIASYERTLIAGDSPFDRWYFGKDDRALSQAAKRGFALFAGRAGCAGCHLVGSSDALFVDDGLHDTGIGYRASMLDPAADARVRIAPDEIVSVASELIDQVAEPVPDDLGRYEITEDPADRWKYKTPSLRNVALTAPYMHDGSIASLDAVVEYYDRGGAPHDLLDPRIRPLGLSAAEQRDLVRFLESLTGNDVDRLVADAHAAVRREAGEVAAEVMVGPARIEEGP